MQQEQIDKIKQRHAKSRWDRVTEGFDKDTDDSINPSEWLHHPGKNIYYLDDGKMYPGDKRMTYLAEIHEGPRPGFQPMPNIAHTLTIRGQNVSSGDSISNLKELGLKMV